MKIAVWKTGHEIADTVAEAVYEGLKRSGVDVSIKSTNSLNDIQAYDCHLAYGILRGTSEVFKQAQENGKLWFNIDKGYFKPSHYDGYYRVSLCGTQQTTFNGLEPDYACLDRLHVDIGSRKNNLLGQDLICPPTENVRQYFGLSDRDYVGHNMRTKNCTRPLQGDLDSCRRVVTFNSSVGWEALRQGIEVVSDPAHSIVGAYQKLIDKPLHLDVNERRKFFAIQASLQLTLPEMRSGHLWPLLQKLLGSTSDMMGVKQLPRTWQHIASSAVPIQKQTSSF